jgi:hypothetical protein
VDGKGEENLSTFPLDLGGNIRIKEGNVPEIKIISKHLSPGCGGKT